MSFETREPLATAADVCAHFEISRMTLWRWTSHGCPVMQYGTRGKQWFRISEVEDWLESLRFKRTDSPAGEDVA